MSDQQELTEDAYAEPGFVKPELPPDPPVNQQVIDETLKDAMVVVDRETGEVVPAEVERYRGYDPVDVSLDEVGKIGRVFAQSGYFKDARDAAQCVTKILAGRELGIGPFQSVAQFHVVEGKPVMSAGLVAAMVKRSGRYDYRITTSTDVECVLDWYERVDGKWEMVGQSSFNDADRERARLKLEGPKGPSGWGKYPRAMFFARALTAGARMYAPDCFGGSIYAEGEIDA